MREFMICSVGMICNIKFSKSFGLDLFSQSLSLPQYVVLCVCLPVPVSLLSKRPSSICLIHFRGSLGAAGDVLVYPPLFSVVETVKEASAVCRSFLDGVVIF